MDLGKTKIWRRTRVEGKSMIMDRNPYLGFAILVLLLDSIQSSRLNQIT